MSDIHPREAARLEAVEKFPFIAVTIQSTGIHPATARIITVDAVTFNAAGETDQEFHAVLNPEINPGPFHQHGLSSAEIEAGQSFSKILKPLDRLIDDRVLVLHNTSRYWGFIVSEARRAMTAAARANRARSRNRNRNRRRQKVGHVPRPVKIVDTLATARRQALPLSDTRLAAVARAAGIDAPSPKATVERAQLPEAQTSRESTLLLIDVYRTLTARAESLAAAPDTTRGVDELIASTTPEELGADRFGLQRSHVRIEAMTADRVHHNPGKFQPGGNLIRGMEIVVAPEIALNPDLIIEGIIREELNYTEKLTRESSVVVCNDLSAASGKAMHAARKDIPLMTDEQFLAALETIEDADPEADRLAAEEAERQAKRRAQAKRDRRRANSNRQNSGSSRTGSGRTGSGRQGRSSNKRSRRRRSSQNQSDNSQQVSKLVNSDTVIVSSTPSNVPGNTTNNTPGKEKGADGQSRSGNNNRRRARRGRGRGNRRRRNQQNRPTGSDS